MIFRRLIHTLLVGTGFYDGNVGGGNTDPGLFKLISLGGLVPTILFYAAFLYFSFKIGIKEKFIWRFLVVAFLIFELKEPLLFKGYAMSVFWIWFGSYLARSKSAMFKSLF